MTQSPVFSTTNMSPEINFIATVGTSITEEFDKPLEEVSEAELIDKAEEYFDGLTEEELRSLYQGSPITIDDPHEIVESTTEA